jgi:hypothetical protein
MDIRKGHYGKNGAAFPSKSPQRYSGSYQLILTREPINILTAVKKLDMINSFMISCQLIKFIARKSGDVLCGLKATHKAKGKNEILSIRLKGGQHETARTDGSSTCSNGGPVSCMF